MVLPLELTVFVPSELARKPPKPRGANNTQRARKMSRINDVAFMFCSIVLFPLCAAALITLEWDAGQTSAIEEGCFGIGLPGIACGDRFGHFG